MRHISGQPARAHLNAYLDGEKIAITNFINGLQKDIVKDVSPGGTTAALAPVGVPPPFGNQPQMGPMPARVKGR